jgi:YbbR domain-containing protein
VELQALDDRGEVVPQVEITPPRVHVKIDVAKELANRSVPIVPHLVGTPPTGYRVQSVTVRPLVVTLSGEQPAVAATEAVDTMPIDVTGQTGPFDTRVGLDLPAEISVAGPGEVAVSVVIGPDSGTRAFDAGIALLNASPTFLYAPSVPKVLVTLGGPLPLLETIDPKELLALVDVQGLGPGTHDVIVRVNPPVGSQVASISPPRINVIVTEPPPTPSPEPTPSASPSPSPSPSLPVAPTGVGPSGPQAQL